MSLFVILTGFFLLCSYAAFCITIHHVYVFHNKFANPFCHDGFNKSQSDEIHVKVLKSLNVESCVWHLQIIKVLIKCA